MAAVKTPPAERQGSRKKLAKQGKALPDGSFPIPNVSYLKKAIRAVGRAGKGKRPALAKLIRKRARELGSQGMSVLKGSWADNTQTSKAMANAYMRAIELANTGCSHKCYPGEMGIFTRLEGKMPESKASAFAHNAAKRAAAAKSEETA
jgi:hypothetical protein